jgi:uncharacterized repeat protein (TIGR01451 family)
MRRGHARTQSVLTTVALGLLLCPPLARAVQPADLSLTNTVSNTAPAIGARVTFTVSVTNAGPGAVQHLGVRDRVPSGYAFISYALTRGTYNQSTGQWGNFGLQRGASAQLVITATVKQSGDRADVAELTSASNSDPDSTPNNGNPAEDDYGQATTAPHRNVAPQITGQQPQTLSTFENTALTVDFGNLVVSDPDNAYPTGFSLTLQPGANYTVQAANQLVPVANYSGPLVVPVIVNDGLSNSAPFSLQVSVAARPTNIVTIMLDDLDNRTLQDLLTAGLLPNVQASIIDRSMHFTESHVTTPLCCPSRSSYYTGEYPHNHKVVSNVLQYPGYDGVNGAVGQFDDSVTVATRLQALGYTTAHIGKYLNGYGSDPSLVPISPAFDPRYVPPGWSNWYGLVDPWTYCMYDYTLNQDGVLTTYSLPNGETEDSALYQTNVLSDIAESFINNHRSDPAPFYLELMPIVPHAERCPDAYDGRPPPNGEEGFDLRIRPAPEYENAVVPAFVPTDSYDEDLTDKPSWLQSCVPLTPGDFDNLTTQYRQRMQAMLSVDDLVRRIVAALGPDVDHTMIVFTSDNGWLYGEHRASGKIYAYEESSAVPLYIALPQMDTAQSSPALVLNNDLAPTLLDLVAPGYSDSRFDGRSLVPLLQGTARGIASNSSSSTAARR